MSKQSVSSTHCKKLSICRVCLISASEMYSDNHYKIKQMWLHFTINTVKTLLVFPTFCKYSNLHAVTHLFNYFENCNIRRKKSVEHKIGFISPIECLLETAFILTNILRVTSKIGTETCKCFHGKWLLKLWIIRLGCRDVILDVNKSMGLIYMACSKSIQCVFIPQKLMEHREVGAVIGRCACTDFFPPADSVRHVQPVCRWVYMQRASHCYFLQKWRNDSSSSIASDFARSLAIAKRKSFGRFSRFSVMMPLASHKLRNGITDSKMATHWWRAMLVPVGPQQDEIISLLTKCGLWSCRTIVSPHKNLWRWE